ncbi:TIGR03086 family metal-binding protein [Microbispora sp. ATCC PTA-5024]|uniref:TIGR03086 family metal-binding protein n=1 Tax=Microbispora sp. ATCC PTA-5024 TaxID=316330 RepID=UPI0003DC4128|nr:TIGR03086 family metal-binding protein [Microbispora sp. ATCC PTA-5024]ETK35925.1 hypothetical protein MPTA5024_11440 [Microbispora sp. ATCC PTA-5024]
MDIRDLDRRAVLASVAMVARIGAGDLARPTPCAGWTLADLLGHMTAQHHGFAAAAEGTGADREAWRVRPLGEDPPAAYAAAAERVTAAFAAEGVFGRRFALPEFGDGAVFPAAQAMGFHFVDYLVHTWDVARSLGTVYEPEPGLAEACRPLALAVPDGGTRLAPGAAFRPALRAPAEASPFAEILAFLGRSPTWDPVARSAPGRSTDPEIQ